jgi:hypothetical protein
VIRPGRLAAALALCGAAVAGCGIGPGEGQGEVQLTVSRDYGGTVLLEQRDSIDESDSVLRVLDRNAEITTRYGGGFIQSIDGLAGGSSGGRRSDWFFYVNGIESPVGAADFDLSGGDRVWWDHRDWTAAMRVPAVVGSWPEPFAHGFRGQRYSSVLLCRDAPAAACDTARDALGGAGDEPRLPLDEDPDAPPPIDVFVGPWSEIRGTSPVSLLSEGPDRSGVFARFVGEKKPLLELLDEHGEPAGGIGRGGGLVAALRPGDGPPTWVVTGTDAKGVTAAAKLLGDQLRNRYAVATQPGAGAIGVPVP